MSADTASIFLYITVIIIEYNKTIDGGGGGIIVANSEPNTTLENVTIRYNYAIYGGGIAQRGSGQFIELSTGNKCNVYGNYATVGTDFYWQDGVIHFSLFKEVNIHSE